MTAIDYSTEQASAYADILAAGDSCTFSSVSPGTYDATTDTYSGSSTTTMAGAAVEVAGDPDTYRDLTIIQKNPATLIWAPATYGDSPAPGMTCAWGGVVRTVRQVSQISPSASTIIATVVLST